eukprot:g3680.t1
MDESQLKQFESLCTAIYTSPHQAERTEAQAAVLCLQSSAEYIPQCQYILNSSKSPFALVVATNSLIKLMTSHWNNFNQAQRFDIRNYVLSYLASHGPSLKDFVMKALIQLTCRITKLGWFDDPRHQQITQETAKFLQAQVPHNIIGLQILNQLVTEVNVPIQGRTLTAHRKVAVSFRDKALFHVFQLSLTTLRQLREGKIAQQADASLITRMAQQALQLTIGCLSFDFIGTNPDESSEDVGAVQVPGAWRPVIQDPATMRLFLDLYVQLQTTQSAKALECVTLLASVRRSLFAGDAERKQYLGALVRGIQEILRTQHGLTQEACYHEFCRLLSKLKTNYQLSELVKTDTFEEWLRFVAKFTTDSFQQWQWSANSMHYLLGLWARLVVAVPYVKPDLQGRSGLLDLYVPELLQAFVQSRLDAAATACASSQEEELLDEEANLREQLERLPAICRYQYPQFGEYLLQLLDPMLQQYQDALRMLMAPGCAPDVPARCRLLEAQLAWLVYIVGSVIGGYSWGSQHREGDELIDADMSRRVFLLIQATDDRLTSSQGRSRCSVHLELALLAYCHSFRASYIGEQHGMPALSATPLEASSMSVKHRVYLSMFERMGLGDHTVVVSKIVTKIGTNLKYWADHESVVGKTLTLFHDIASGYSSSKLLMSLDTVKYLLEHHTEEHFPFLGIPGNTRYRTTFYATLSRLLYTSLDDGGHRLDVFVRPLLSVLSSLASVSVAEFQQENAKNAIIGVCRDLRGITASTLSRQTYGAVFDNVYGSHRQRAPTFAALSRALSVWVQEPAVTTAIFRFMMEFVFNKNQRLVFHQSSPNAGNYVNFGVFTLYEDKALEDAFTVALQLALCIVDSGELMVYPKVSKAYFTFIEIMFRNHIDFILNLDSVVFGRIVRSLHEGLDSPEGPLLQLSAAIADHMASFYFRNMTKAKPSTMQATQALRAHFTAHPSMLSDLLSLLFNILIFGEASHYWSISRPILSIILCDDRLFADFQQRLLGTQAPDKRQKLQEAFNNLLVDVDKKLEQANRDKFTQKVTSFRHNVRGFLTRDAGQ